MKTMESCLEKSGKIQVRISELEHFLFSFRDEMISIMSFGTQSSEGGAGLVGSRDQRCLREIEVVLHRGSGGAE